MALTPQQQTLLNDYRAAYGRLSTGGQVTEVTSNGRTVKYAKGDIARLERDIAELEALAARPSDLPIRRRGALSIRL
jgi:hypothetical protein